MLRESPEFRQILSFDGEINLKIDREFLKDCFYDKNTLNPSEKAYLSAIKQEAETTLFKIQHILSVISRIQNKLC